MTTANYKIVTQDGVRTVTAIVDGNLLVTSDETNPNFDEIAMRLFEGKTANIEVLFTAEKAVEESFKRVSERVQVLNGEVYFDGDVVHNALSEHMLSLIYKGEDVSPLVAFWEKIAQNPSEHSRAQLFEWLNRHKFTITADGDILAYKGLRSDSTSVHAGPGIVDGKPMNGHLPNKEGSIVEIGRSKVVADSFVGCASGLHVGTYEYASSFGHGVTVEAYINPRDVVSVPTDCDAQKVRVCRYRVGKASAAKRTESVATDVSAKVDNDWASDADNDALVSDWTPR